MRASNGEWKPDDPKTSVVLFGPSGAGGGVKARLRLQQLMDESTRAFVCKQIILGALSGTFEAEGMLVKITSFVVEASKLTKVRFDVVDDAGDTLFEGGPVPIGKFVKDYESPAGPAVVPEANFDFAPYPKLLASMRAAAVVPRDSSILLRDQALAFLTGIDGGVGVDSSSLMSAAVAAEAAASTIFRQSIPLASQA